MTVEKTHYFNAIDAKTGWWSLSPLSILTFNPLEKARHDDGSFYLPKPS